MRNALSTSKPPHFDWAALDARRPGPDVGAVADALRQRYALDGQLVHLASERDGVYRLDVRGSGAQVVRVSSAAEPEASLLLQNEALRTVARTDPALPVPRIVASVTGLDVERIETPRGPYRVRVMSYLPGTPVLQNPRSPAMLASIGRTLARLDEALRFVTAVDHKFPLLWDLRSAPRLASFVECIASASGRAAVEAVLAELDSSGLARPGRLPSLPARLSAPTSRPGEAGRPCERWARCPPARGRGGRIRRPTWDGAPPGSGRSSRGSWPA